MKKLEILPLENGDRLTRQEFEQRYHAMPHLKKAELIEGVVYMPSPLSTKQTAQTNDTSVKIPPLENGDRLTRQEFERRYHAMPNLKKAELIEGVVHMGSPLRFESHAKPHSYINWWLVSYHVATPGVEPGDNATTRLDLDNEPQPDALLRIIESGQSSISEDDYIEGAPELVVEVAASSATYDLHNKLRIYRRNGVQEYIVWRVYDSRLDWFRLREGEYVTLEPDAVGVVRSEVFPGLWLAVTALLAGNLAEVQAVLQAGLATEEHAAFVNERSGNV